MSSSHYSDSSLNAAMRQVLTEGQSHTVPDADGFKKMAAIRAALSSYQARNCHQKKPTSSQPSGSSSAALDVKNAPPVAAPESQSSTENTEQQDVYAGRKFALDSNAVGKAPPPLSAEHFTSDVSKIMLNCLGGDIHETKAVPFVDRQAFRLFELKITLEDMLLPLATRAAKLILGGEAKEVEEAIELVRKHPDILHCCVKARDRSGSPGFCIMTNETDDEIKKNKHLYIKRAEDNGLYYKVLNPKGELVEGRITSKQLNQEFKEQPTLHSLNALAGPILDITSSRGHTPLGRKVEGKLIQIAAMAGDVNLQDSKDIKEEDRGVVERLALIEGGLKPEEVAKQLDEVITGVEAQRENEQRNNRILEAVKKFGRDIQLKASEYKNDKQDYNNFKEFQQLCQPCIDELEQALRPNPNEVIKSGYISDPAILQKSLAWFEEKVRDFGGWDSIVSDVFWVNGYGKLQLTLSARDGHVMRHGIGYVVDQKQMPPRRLNNNDDGTSFLTFSSDVGRDFYLGYYGRAHALPTIAAGGWKTYVNQKQQRCKSYATFPAGKTERVFSNVTRL